MNVKIDSPCSEDWSKMKIGLISRHCDKCDKAVMDFTKMNRAEILMHLMTNPNDEVCGRMTRDQFDFHHNDIPILIEALKKKGGNASFLILSLVCLSLVACKEDNSIRNIKPTTDATELLQGKMEVHDTISKKDNASKVVPQEVCKKNKAVIDPVEPIMLGEMIVVNPDPDPGVAGGISYEPFEDAYGDQEDALSFAEKMPEYPGGVEALMTFIKKNLRYPDYEKENNIQGTVYARFVVEHDGSLTGIEILRSVKDSRNFDKEVTRIIKAMPNWAPGENKNKKVRVYYTIPVRFTLY